jgi:hypothetical protein
VQSLTHRQLHDAICSSTGIMSCHDAISFDAAVEKVRAAELAQGTAEFQAYFERRLLPLLRANVAIGMNKWTSVFLFQIHYTLFTLHYAFNFICTVLQFFQ